MRDKKWLNLINACLYGACAVLWSINGFRDGDLFDFLLSAVWLAGTVIWLVRYFKGKKKEK